MTLRNQRVALGMSQSRLARVSGVSRYKICIGELGGESFSPEEWERLIKAIRGEADRLRYVTAQIVADNLPRIDSNGTCTGLRNQTRTVPDSD